MLSCHHGPRGRVATARRVAARWVAPRRAAAERAAASLAVLLAVLGPVLGAGPARAAAGSDRLLPGEVLLAGESISAGRDTLTMQATAVSRSLDPYCVE
jgi:hypothetical protein